MRGTLVFVLISILGSPALADQNDSRLDALFEQLGSAETTREAARIEQQIWSVWLETDDASVEASMARGLAAMSSGNYPAALRAFDSIVASAPDFAERESVIFESAVILEYLDETLPNPLHPADPLERARHRGWIEYGSAILNRIARFYSAPGPTALANEARELAAMFARVEAELGDGPWFAGERFSLVDAVFGPVLRYFDVIDEFGDFGILSGKPKIAAWRKALAQRPSVRDAVTPDYPERLLAFFEHKRSALMRRLAA